MAINVKRLAKIIKSSNTISNLIFHKSQIQHSYSLLPETFIPTFTSYRKYSSRSAGVTGHVAPEDVDDEREERDVLKWHKGGGMFHKSARIDPTAFIDFGAVVHSGSLVGGNVHVGSGAVVGPNVTIGQSTKIGYAHSPILIQLYPGHMTYQCNGLWSFPS